MTVKQTKRAEAGRICNLLPARHDTTRDWQIETALEAKAIASLPATLPASVDLRDDSWWKIGDQENTGSCVGWGTTDGVARYHFVKAGRLGPNELLSVRHSWMGAKESDVYTAHPTTVIESSGTFANAALTILKKYGAVTDAVLPFHISTVMYTGEESTFYATAATRRIAGYFNLGKNLVNWRLWLAAHGPIVAGVNVDETWDNAKATHGKLDVFKPATVRGGHCIAIVGYTADKRFIVRNSWGTDWGENGYAYASEAYINAGFQNDNYGITI